VTRYVVREKMIRGRMETAMGRIDVELRKRHSPSRVVCDIRGDFVLDLQDEKDRKVMERELGRVVVLEEMIDPAPMNTQCGVCEEAKEELEISLGVVLRGRPARAGIGVVFCSASGEMLGSLGRALGPMGEPSAAYSALILGLEGAPAWGDRKKMKITVRGDSPSLSSHLDGGSLPKHYKVLSLHRAAERALGKFREWRWVLVEPGENREALKRATEEVRRRYGT
jgi:ribonuclease HI